MATQCKVYTNVRQPVPPNTWYRIGFDVVLRNDFDMFTGNGDVTNPDSTVIVPEYDGDFIWMAKVKFDDIGQPVGSERQFNVRFVRDPYTAPDNTGEEDGDDTVGQDLRGISWAFRGHAGQPVAVEVRHTHDQSVDIIHAQFLATTWDY